VSVVYKLTDKDLRTHSLFLNVCAEPRESPIAGVSIDRGKAFCLRSESAKNEIILWSILEKSPRNISEVGGDDNGGNDDPGSPCDS